MLACKKNSKILITAYWENQNVTNNWKLLSPPELFVSGRGELAGAEDGTQMEDSTHSSEAPLCRFQATPRNSGMNNGWFPILGL